MMVHSFALNFLLRLAFFPACVFLVVRYLSRVRKFLQWATFIEIILVVVAAAILTVRITAPLAYHIADHVPWSLVDGYYIAYVQAWDVHALSIQPLHVFDANFFFPTKQALALSENHLGNMPIFAPVHALTGNSILASNVVMLATFFLSAIAMYVLIRLWLGNSWAAAVAGFAYGFAAARVYQMPRVHIINLQLIPLIILFLLRFLNSGRLANLVLFTTVMFFQLLCSLHAGVFAACVVMAFLLAQLLESSDYWARRAMAVLASLVVVGIMLLPLAIPYLKWERQGVLSTLNLPAELYSATPSSYLNGDSALYPDLLKRFQAPIADYEKKLFFGFLPLGLSLLAFVEYLVKSCRLRRGKGVGKTPAKSGAKARPASVLTLGALISIVFGFVLSLGPSVHLGSRLIHLPYYWLSRFLPGFHAVRYPCRFGFIVLFGVAILAGLGYARTLDGVFRLRSADSLGIRAALTVALLFVMFWEFSVELHTAPAPIQPAPEYRFLSSQAAGSVTLELPTISWRVVEANAAELSKSKVEFPGFTREAAYAYSSSFHWQPIMNGVSGHVSPVTYEISSLAVELPSRNAIVALAHYGLRFVILHLSVMSAEERAAWQNLPATSGLTQVASFPDAVVYKVHD